MEPKASPTMQPTSPIDSSATWNSGSSGGISSTATGWTGTPHPCDEGELAWIKKAELRGLPMWEGDKIFLRLLEENVPFFSLKLQYQGDRLDRAVLNGRRIV